MEIQELQKQLEETKTNRQRAEIVYHQLNGQCVLLEELIRKEEEKLKPTE